MVGSYCATKEEKKEISNSQFFNSTKPLMNHIAIKNCHFLQCYHCLLPLTLLLQLFFWLQPPSPSFSSSRDQLQSFGQKSLWRKKRQLQLPNQFQMPSVTSLSFVAEECSTLVLFCPPCPWYSSTSGIKFKNTNFFTCFCLWSALNWLPHSGVMKSAAILEVDSVCCWQTKCISTFFWLGVII